MFAPNASAAFIMIGPWIAHCPPPEGMKIFTSPAFPPAAASANQQAAAAAAQDASCGCGHRKR